MSELNRHGNVSNNDDPVEALLNKTGCADLHYAVQECIAEHKDWRKCQEQVKQFRLCIENNSKKK